MRPQAKAWGHRQQPEEAGRILSEGVLPWDTLVLYSGLQRGRTSVVLVPLSAVLCFGSHRTKMLPSSTHGLSVWLALLLDPAPLD